MIAEGLVKEGLAITRMIHDRYHPLSTLGLRWPQASAAPTISVQVDAKSVPARVESDHGRLTICWETPCRIGRGQSLDILAH